MLSPEFLATLPESVVALFLQVEEDLLEDIARRIAKMDGITDTAKWQAWRYEQVKLFSSNALQTLAAAIGKSKEELVQLFREAALETLAADNEIYTAAGLTVPETLSPTLQNILQSGYLQTGQMMENFTATTANTVTRQFENALDRAWLQINTGGFTYQQAIRKAIQTLAQDGLSAIVYPSGHRDTIETAVRRAVLTGVNQTAAKLQIARMEEMGCEFVEVTAHPGARPSHAVWQGKVFHIGGAVTVDGVYYPDFVTATGYGTGAGLGGWNCRHNFFPFFPGLSKRAYTEEMLAQLDAKEISYRGKDYTRYEASQMQRALERKIRKAKREYLSLDAAGQDTAESAVKLRQARAQLNDFLKETGLRQDNFREQVAGFGRSAASKAAWKHRKELEKYLSIHYNKNGTIVVTDDWKNKGKVTIPQKYKPHAVVETQTVYKNGTVQIDRTIYDENGMMSIQIHSGPHNRPDKHPFGKHGEHIHRYIWNEDGELAKRDSAELSDLERAQHQDILGGEEIEPQ